MIDGVDLMLEIGMIWEYGMKRKELSASLSLK